MSLTALQRSAFIGTVELAHNGCDRHNRVLTPLYSRCPLLGKCEVGFGDRNGREVAGRLEVTVSGPAAFDICISKANIQRD
jgi:hypothetical protein